ncbi:histidine kinase [Massilia sp. WF1]|uniref:heavy metal sensor histidine kinase n=1 Tax=unclassified Massilia TaxID=2609279 RepID=UPI00064959BD|nr:MULTISPECIES: heavy metal sensor histidine kinase [unclassified Massilia]ALK97880.1 histidine kinase [Massilia sp. WG5]KLU35776.1 histidine kinase [Massilia sp. WF1]
MGWPRALSQRLALMFALSSALLLGAIGAFLYASLEREIAWRDDQALAGRVDRMRVLLEDSADLEALRRRPRLYENMMGNRDSLLWIVDDAGQVRIAIDPVGVPAPRLPHGDGRIALRTLDGAQPLRLAWMHVPGPGGGGLTLVAGTLLAGREHMLGAYRRTLWGALVAGSGLAYLLGLAIGVRGLRPVRRLAARAAAIDVRHLSLRLDDASELRELSELRTALNGMLARLEAGFVQLARFSEDLAHEMRTPLGNLMGQTQQALSRSRTVEDYQNLLVSNQEEYERLARMIDSMLFLARSEQASAAVVREAVDLHGLAAQLCEYFEGMAEERGMRLLNGAQGTLAADRELLRRALANLLGNAVRYGAPGTAITVATAAAAAGAGSVEISVHNLGAPIPPEHLPHLFERFYRADPARHGAGESGGLGLAIVRSILQLHGGEVRVESGAGGTRFVLIFPQDRGA